MAVLFLFLPHFYDKRQKNNEFSSYSALRASCRFFFLLLFSRMPGTTFYTSEMKIFFNLFDFSQNVNYKTEVLAGVTVALALIPEAVAFAFIAELSPLTGIYAAFVMCLVTSVLGGRPGMISGATGAVAVVIVALSISHGPEYIFATVILAGLFQILAGILRLGKLIRLVPQSVIFGFVNGLAIIILT